MRLDEVHEAELARRKGNTWKTILQLIWLGLCAVGAYYVTTYLFGAGILGYPAIYRQLGSLDFISESGIFWIIVTLIVFVVQLAVYAIYALLRPSGWRSADTLGRK